MIHSDGWQAWVPPGPRRPVGSHCPSGEPARRAGVPTVPDRSQWLEALSMRLQACGPQASPRLAPRGGPHAKKVAPYLDSTFPWPAGLADGLGRKATLPGYPGLTPSVPGSPASRATSREFGSGAQQCPASMLSHYGPLINSLIGQVPGKSVDGPGRRCQSVLTPRPAAESTEAATPCALASTPDGWQR